jgi:hypothetical protein
MAKEKRERRRKPLFEEHINCAWCSKPNIVRGHSVTIQKGIPAQRKLEVFVERDDQKGVDDFGTKKIK